MKLNPFKYLKADSHEVRAAAADGCISAEIGNFLFFRTCESAISTLGEGAILQL